MALSRSHAKTGSKLTPGETSEESFVKIGTPLPPLTSTKADKNEFVPLWQQEVKDEKGRKRLHGAFTGGFSAGYFNTVGSKEGWTPAEFKSSRTDKKNHAPSGTELASEAPSGRRVNQRPEDFMDEEDLAELEGRKELQTNLNFSQVPGKAPVLPVDQYDPLAGNLQTSSYPDPSQPPNSDGLYSVLLERNVERIGRKIMIRMGWRDGQGVGPRIPYHKKGLLAHKMGIKIDLEIDVGEEAEHQKHLFAPVDRPLTGVQPWHNSFGLGFGGRSQYPPQHHSNLSSLAANAGPSLSIQGQNIPQGASFGLGALNDFEDDDRDVYDSGPLQITQDARARHILSLAEGNDKGRIRPTPDSQPSGRSIAINAAPPKLGSFQDGTNLPKGFQLALSAGKQLGSNQYYPTKVPHGWEPNPKSIWNNKKSSDHLSQTTSNPRKTQPMTAHDVCSDLSLLFSPFLIHRALADITKSMSGQRGRLIGEKAPVKSVFDFISSKNKARLEEAKKLSQHVVSAKAEDSTTGQVPSQSTSLIVPKLDPQIAQAALRGFMPFSHDLKKQQRYKLYLQSQAGLLADGVQFAPKPNGEESVDVINKELDGFVKSALMFKPMSAMMASRFTSAANLTSGGELAAPEPGLRQPVFTEEKLSEPADTQKEGKVETEISQAAQAVRMNMFGQITRTSKPFYPDKLLCKRLNVPNPFPGGPPVATTSAETSSSKLSEFLTANGFQAAVPTPKPNDEVEATVANDKWLTTEAEHVAPKPLDEVGLGNDDSQGREILSAARPSMDLFKAIFATESDSDQEDDADGHSYKAIHPSRPDPVPNPEDLTAKLAPMNDTSEEDKLKLSSEQVTKNTGSLVPVTVDPKAAENLATFRPQFSRRDHLKTKTKEGEKKRKNKNKKTGTLMSFEEDNEDEPMEVEPKVKHEKKKNKKTGALMSLEEDHEGEPMEVESKVKHQNKKKSSRTSNEVKLEAKSSSTMSNLEDGRKNRAKEGYESAKRRTDEVEEDEWVEKVAAPTVISSSGVDSNQNVTASTLGSRPGGTRKVKRLKASDLMD